MGMQYADDLNPLPFRPVDHQVHSAGMDAYRGFELAAFPGHLRKVSEQVEERKQTIRIVIGLLYTPVVCAVVPDVDKSVSAADRMTQRLILRHIRRASGLERAAIKWGRQPAGEAYVDSGLNFRNGLTTGTVTPDQVANIVAGIMA